ncbi:hypothetical protein [Limnobacter sp.]|uniref:hypothetical protein n=1 Tax=Limnobacter sp. TaxID=2003368 RepID=UPI0025B9A5E2|nr:hypothetical protein [Limnobacter sp.]
MPSISNFRTQVIDVTLTHPASTFASGDVIAATQAIVLGPTTRPARGTINNVIAIDCNSTGKRFDIVFLDGNVSIGSEDTTASISVSDSTKVLSVVDSGVSWVNLGNANVAQVSPFAPIPYNSDNSTIYIGAIARESTTHAYADYLKLRFFISIENS